MRGLAIIGGEGPGPVVLQRIASGVDLIAAADSGLAAAEEAGLRPDWIVGDMDSLDDPRRLDKYPPERVRRFPSEKDFTDTELALALLREQGCGEVWLSGGGGGRVDHLFAIRCLFESEAPPARWFPGKDEIRLLPHGGTLSEDIPGGSIVSLFPAGKEGWEAKSSGLKWPLDGLSWKSGGCAVSNVAVSGHFEIHSIRGRFMVILPERSGNEQKRKGGK